MRMQLLAVFSRRTREMILRVGHKLLSHFTFFRWHLEIFAEAEHSCVAAFVCNLEWPIGVVHHSALVCRQSVDPKC